MEVSLFPSENVSADQPFLAFVYHVVAEVKVLQQASSADNEEDIKSELVIVHASSQILLRLPIDWVVIVQMAERELELSHLSEIVIAIISVSDQAIGKPLHSHIDVANIRRVLKPNAIAVLQHPRARRHITCQVDPHVIVSTAYGFLAHNY